MALDQAGEKRRAGKSPFPIPETTREVPAIVDGETWQRAQETMRRNLMYSPRNSRRQYLLRGLVKCGDCGLNYIGAHYMTAVGDERHYYSRPGQDRHQDRPQHQRQGGNQTSVGRPAGARNQERLHVEESPRKRRARVATAQPSAPQFGCHSDYTKRHLAAAPAPDGPESVAGRHPVVGRNGGNPGIMRPGKPDGTGAR